MSAARAVLDAEVEDVEAHLCEGGGGGSAGKTRPDNDHVKTTLVGWVDELLMSLIVGPFLSDRTLRDFGISRTHYFDVFCCIFHIAI